MGKRDRQWQSCGRGRPSWSGALVSPPGQVGEKTMQAQPRAPGVKSLAAPVVTVVVVLCAGFLLWRGSSLVLAGAMTVGMLIVFLTYLAYLGKFFKPVQQLSGQADTTVATAAAAQRIQAILETEDVIERPDAVDP